MNEEEYIKEGMILMRIIASYINKRLDWISSLSEDEVKELYEIASVHSVNVLLFKSLEFLGYYKNNAHPESFGQEETLYLKNLRKTLVFAKERELFTEFCTKERIPYLPLKGIVIGQMYPEEGIREFADNDIAVNPSDAAKVKEFFSEHGYEVEIFNRGIHDSYLKKPFLNFEIHRSLIANDDGNKNLVDYINGLFSKAEFEYGKMEKYLSEEDFVLYFLAHAYKHYIHGGFGLRTIIDFFLITRKYLNIDWQDVEKKTNVMGLNEFYHDLWSLSEFLNGNNDAANRDFFLYILSSGTYGEQSHSIDHGIAEYKKDGMNDRKARRRYLWKRIFPPRNFYKTNYPKAYRYPFLIPLAWMRRMIRIAFHPKNARSELKYLNDLEKKSSKD